MAVDFIKVNEYNITLEVMCAIAFLFSPLANYLKWTQHIFV